MAKPAMAELGFEQLAVDHTMLGTGRLAGDEQPDAAEGALIPVVPPVLAGKRSVHPQPGRAPTGTAAQSGGSHAPSSVPRGTAVGHRRALPPDGRQWSALPSYAGPGALDRQADRNRPQHLHRCDRVHRRRHESPPLHQCLGRPLQRSPSPPRLGQAPPLGLAQPPVVLPAGGVVRRDRLGGLIHEYAQAA